MTSNPILNTVLASTTAICLAVTEIPAIELTETLNIIARLCGILSFVIILVSNWSRFNAQIKEWFNKKDND
jgi:hypothetical protein